MPRPEFLAWIEFFKLEPFDDYSRYHRPAALVAHSMAGAPLDDLLSWLARVQPATDDRFSAADLATMKALGVKPPKGMA